MNKIKKRTVVTFLFTAFFATLFGAILGLLLANTVNTKNIENFTDFNPSLPTRLLDINGEVITEFASDEKREMIDIQDLPQHIIDALVTREDKIFFNHNGFSVKALTRAVVGVVTGRSLGGGSTLTQQIAGTIYCDRTEKSVIRKFKELWWAVQMERRYAKNEILELYLNKIYFGGGTYGVSAASKYYFGHPTQKMTPAESAILVIQLSNPARFNPFDHPDRAMDRQHEVLRQMVVDGKLTNEVAEASFDEYWLNFDYTRTNSSAYYMREDKAPWYSEYVLRELTSMMYGTLDVYTGGFTVNTAMNLKHQETAQKLMTDRIAFANREYQRSSGASKNVAASTYIPFTELMALVFDLPSLKVSEQRNEFTTMNAFNKEINPILDVMSLMFGTESLKVSIVNRANSSIRQNATKNTVEGAFVSIENETGYVTAIVGGSKFDVENQFIRATQALVQPGSAFKPLMYSAAIDSRKFTATTAIDDSPYVFYTEGGDPYMPENYGGVWRGSVQLWYALARSLNIPALKILEGIGFDATINRSVALLGIPDNEVQSRGFKRVYPLALGIVSVHPIELCRAFAVFGNQGKEVTPIAIRSVEDRSGKVILNPERDIRLEQKRKGSAIQVITPQNAYIMTKLLESANTVGTLAGSMQSGRKLTYTNPDGSTYIMPSAGKTGTTQNWADGWAVGYTPYITAALWFGFDQKGLSLGMNLSGASLAGNPYAEFMYIANEDYSFKNFSEPQTGIVRATVCSVSGQILSSACGNHAVSQVYLEGTEPHTVCEYHSRRNDAKQIAVNRLETERYLSGEKNNLVEDDDNPLQLDLSFLEGYEKPKTTTKKTTTKKKTTTTKKTNKNSNNLLEDDEEENSLLDDYQNVTDIYTSDSNDESSDDEEFETTDENMSEENFLLD